MDQSAEKELAIRLAIIEYTKQFRNWLESGNDQHTAGKT